MPKTILNLGNNEDGKISETMAFKQSQSFENPNIVLRKKRSKKYIEEIKKLDITAHNITQEQIQGMIDAIKNELPVISIDDLPIGIVTKCYLGESYEVHTLSLIGKSIIRHYKIGESLPNELEKARTLANNKNYAFIEVYQTKIIAVKEDGSVSILEDKK